MASRWLALQVDAISEDEVYQVQIIMKNRVAVIIKNDTNILLIHRIKNEREYYVIPGGSIEINETLEEAAIREIKEETGLDIIIDKFLYPYNNEGRLEYYFLSNKFYGQLALGNPEKERNNENNIYKLEWTSIEKIHNIKLYPIFIKNKISIAGWSFTTPTLT